MDRTKAVLLLICAGLAIAPLVGCSKSGTGGQSDQIHGAVMKPDGTYGPAPGVENQARPAQIPVAPNSGAQAQQGNAHP